MIFSCRLSSVLGVALLLSTLVPLSAAAQTAEEDAEGCKDAKLLPRMQGCFILSCETKEFDSAEVVSGKIDGVTGEQKTKNLEGAIELREYTCKKTLSSIQVQRNVKSALEKTGFESVFSGKNTDSFEVVTLRKAGLWASVVAWSTEDETIYKQAIVQTKEMAQELVADANAMADEINKSGRVSVHGIEFDTGKATIKPASEKVLDEIATLLGNNPDWKLTVEGHTDNVGVKTTNQKLSEQRAAAVVEWLGKKGVDKKRLTPKGFGDSKPLGDNTTDEGRKNNRRVELSKT